MKLTKSQLKQLIKEELQNISLQEQEPASGYEPRASFGGVQVCGEVTCDELNAEMDAMVALIKTLGGCWPPRGSRWAPPPGEALPGEECP